MSQDPTTVTLRPDESVHISIKRPPKTSRRIGIFENQPIEEILEIVKSLLQEYGGPGKHASFHTNVRQEVDMLLNNSSILGVAAFDEEVEGSVYCIYVKPKIHIPIPLD